MISLISKTTAMDIAFAYREIEAAERLLAEIEDAQEKRVAPDIRNAFGDRHDGLELGVPNGKGSQRLFNVPWTLARPIIEAHIASQKARLSVLTEKARIEMSGCANE
nr:hypothetical protein [Brucella anthropi]DAM62872.1 MAG TPA: hypothetical protein [Caudoviricetes sp.]